MKHLNLKRIAAGALSLVLAAGIPVLLVTGVIGAKASATSLPYIESIVSNLKSGGSFHILEIVPQDGTGSIGYYAAGQEPSSSWSQELAAITEGTCDSDGAYASAAEARTQRMGEILTDLSAAGLLGDSSSTPLKSAGNYSEVYPWARISDVDYGTLHLNHTEKVSSGGVFTKKAEGDTSSGFDYTQQATYNIVPSGSYVQNISSFISVAESTDSADTYFYYSPTFAALSETVADGFTDKNIPVYTNTATPAGSSADPDPSGYVYYGTLKDGLESGQNYYYVESTGAPSAEQGTNLYKAKLDATDPYQQVSENGYFNLTVTGYTYVGDGLGVYRFTPDPSGDSFAITYSTVYYTGGYTNNNWFLTKVLDVDPDSDDVNSIHVQVDSLTPAEISSEVQSQIENSYYGLIVLSNGFLPGGGTIAPYSSSNDLSADTKTALETAVSVSKTPVVMDHALAGDGLNIGSLAYSLAGGSSPTTFVEGNLYVIDSPLATAAFDTAFTPDSQFNVSGAPFYDVYYEIYHENFLRKTEDPNTTDLLPETVSMANSIRYIINYQQQRPITKKTSIRVLEIEPGRGSDTTTSALKEKIRGWTGLPNTLSDGTTDPITIDRMSTAEFIGKIDDLIEKYDMIYVGSDLTGFNRSSSGSTVYNDASMDGLIYSNIGDQWVTDTYKISGLLDQDYSASQTDSSGNPKIQAGTTARTFRLSGNDITETKVRELENFAAAGHPVIVADNLMSEVPALTADFTFTAQILKSGDTLTASYSPSTLPSGLTASYQWFKDDSAIEGATASAYTPTVDEGGGTYTCRITIGGVTATSNAADVRVISQYQIDAADPSKAVAGDWSNYSSGGTLYTISVTHIYSQDNFRDYDISVTPDNSSDNVSYQWYGYDQYHWITLSGETSSHFYDLYPYSYYCCEITINGVSLYTEPISWSSTFQESYTERLANVEVTSSINTSGASLTARLEPTVSDYVLYRWVNVANNNYNQSNTLTATSGTYYCMAYVYNNSSDQDRNSNRINPRSYDASARSNNYTISGGKAVSISVASGSGGSATVPAHSSQLSVQPATVDNSSKIYNFLSYAANRKNTFISADDLDKSMLVQYLNLSAPKINLTATPTEYTGTDSYNTTGRTLTYQFTISNETDITPVSTRYNCNFYIDGNADGKYSDSEQLADILITDSSGVTISSGELQAGLSYTVTRRLPSNYAGILPWKLEVVKVGDESVHASRSGYTRIEPDSSAQKTSIKILQLLNSNGISGSSLNLITNGTYLNLFPSAEDFNLTISTINISGSNNSGINNSGPYTVSTRNVSSAAGTVTSQTFTSRADLLDNYDMLVLGFADCYGDLNSAAAAAVTGFINSGKSVLFTHDTTSICNLPYNYYPITSGSTVDQGSYYWGYNFNTIVRDAVKLDRYGVTNPTFGVTQYCPNKGSGSQDFNVAAGESTLSSANLQTLAGAGYSIAYQPGSSGTTALDEVQGSTVAALIGQSSSSSNTYLPSSDSNTYFKTDGGNYLTTSVSQVNQGQITTYPFNLNMEDFTAETDSTKAPLCNQSVMTIAPTHNQYYQLNMNSDDIVVWYCLADGSSSKTSDNIYGCTPNDVMNNYYIYSVGNVTYSGAGHSGDSVSTYEAELFINTMIAAYRPAHTAPSIEIVNSASGTTPVSTYYLTADYSKESDSIYSNSLVEKSGGCPIYFKITDTNLDPNRIIVISVSDGSGTYTYGTDAAALKIYRADISSSAVRTDLNNTSSIFTDHVYYFDLPQGILTSFGSNTNGSTENLTIQVSTEFSDSSAPLSGSTTLKLEKIGLLSLG